MTQLSLSPLNDTVELQGTLERVVFHNEENGYTVFRVRPEGKDEVDLVTVVGHMGSPQAGASLRIKGRWVNNARFGRQVQMDSFESLLPATAEGIKLYPARASRRASSRRSAKTRSGFSMRSRSVCWKFPASPRRSW